jgi:ribosomal protein S18 acetylase RimI-like enzyme
MGWAAASHGSCMVLVLPQCRGRGHASRLLREALAWLSARGLVPVLDATPAGHSVYRREGFVDTWGLARHARDGGAPAPRAALPEGLRIEPLQDAHWPGLRALDAPAMRHPGGAPTAPACAPGDPSTLRLIAGPELG